MQTSGRIPQEDVFGVLLAILEVHGVTAVRSGNLYKIVPVEGARERAVPTIVGADRRPHARRRRDHHADRADPLRAGERPRHAAAAAHLGPGHAHRQPRDGRAHHHRLGVQHRPPARHHPARRRRGGHRRAADHPAAVRRRRRDGEHPEPALPVGPSAGRRRPGAPTARAAGRADPGAADPGRAAPGQRHRRGRPAAAHRARAALELAHRQRAQGRDGDDPPASSRRSTSTSPAAAACSSTTPRTPSQGPGGDAQRDLRRPRDGADDLVADDLGRQPGRPPRRRQPGRAAATTADGRPRRAARRRRRPGWPRARCGSSPTR